MTPRRAAAVGAVVMFFNTVLYLVLTNPFAEFSSDLAISVAKIPFGSRLYGLASDLLWRPAVVLNSYFEFVPFDDQVEVERYLIGISMEALILNTIIGAVLGLLAVKMFKIIRSRRQRS
jgi:hypothetical protein